MPEEPEDPEYPQRGYTTRDIEAMKDDRPRPGFFRRHWGKILALAVVVVPAVVFTIWAGIALAISYSAGDRVGYVQKLSERGWVCKTWEGELAMSNVPGSMPEKFYFSVRDDSIARAINAAQGRRVSLTYEQHKGVPSSCFGETEYYVTGVKVLPGE
jgi:hypothetical protein